MGDSSDSFTFSFAAAQQTAWEDVHAAPADHNAESAAALEQAAQDASAKATAAIEEELLSRFQDQLEAVMEESLGPLLASGGALDPQTARNIARDTSARPHVALLACSTALNAPARGTQCWRASATKLRA